MRMLQKLGMTGVRKAVLGAASASPRVFVGIGGPVVVRGYYAPAPYWRPVYVAPRYRAYYGPRHRFWDARLHRWCYR